MQINLNSHSGAYSIRSYGAGEILVNLPAQISPEFLQQFSQSIDDVNDRMKSIRVQENIILTPKEIVTDILPASADELDRTHFEHLLSYDPEIVILGTGDKLRFPSPDKTRSLMEKGIGLEVMGTAAACRTFNFLAVDGRRIAAALFMI